MTLTISSMTAKEQSHHPIGDLSKEKAAKLRLVDDVDPLLRAIADAPEDDEPFTADDEAAIAEVESDRASGKQAIPFEEVVQKYRHA
jgi:hypothetical protein